MELPLFKIYADDDELSEVARVIARKSYWTMGNMVRVFENQVAEYFNKKHAVAFNSGTSALHGALHACGVERGDEVIVPSFTFISTANAPLFVGARPIFADIEKETFGLDPERVMERITNRTKAIIPVHFAGCPCQIRALKEIAEDHRLALIEDCAEAFGATFNRRKVGTFGEMGVFSFCQNKIITTAEGGMVVTNDGFAKNQMELLRSHGRIQKPGESYFLSNEDHVSLGYNFRMSDIHAALGYAQFSKLGLILRLRRNLAKILNKRFGSISELTVWEPPQGYHHAYQMYNIWVNGGETVRDSLQTYLRDRGVASKVYFHPVHLNSLYKNSLGWREGVLPVTEEVSKHLVAVPFYPGMKKEEVEYLESAVRGGLADA